MKIIFLDIDGVLNTCHSAKRSEVPVHFKNDIIGFNQLDELCIKRVNKITDVTGACIVITSTWRIPLIRDGNFGALRLHLENQGVTGKVIDHTPAILQGIRNSEIAIWLDGRDNIEAHVIIDDDLAWFSYKPDNMVHVYPNGWVTGIRDEHVEEAIRILNGY